MKRFVKTSIILKQSRKQRIVVIEYFIAVASVTFLFSPLSFFLFNFPFSSLLTSLCYYLLSHSYFLFLFSSNPSYSVSSFLHCFPVLPFISSFSLSLSLLPSSYPSSPSPFFLLPTLPLLPLPFSSSLFLPFLPQCNYPLNHGHLSERVKRGEGEGEEPISHFHSDIFKLLNFGRKLMKKKKKKKCIKLRNYCAGILIIEALLSDSIGRLTATWQLISTKKILTLQNLLIFIKNTLNFHNNLEQLQRAKPIIPDIECILNEYIKSSTPNMSSNPSNSTSFYANSSSNSNSCKKINFTQGKIINQFLEYLKNLSYLFDGNSKIRKYLMHFKPLPDDLIHHFSVSHEYFDSYKPKPIQFHFNSLVCSASRGRLSVINGKLDDFLHLILDPSLSLFVLSPFPFPYLLHSIPLFFFTFLLSFSLLPILLFLSFPFPLPSFCFASILLLFVFMKIYFQMVIHHHCMAPFVPKEEIPFITYGWSQYLCSIAFL